MKTTREDTPLDGNDETAEDLTTTDPADQYQPNPGDIAREHIDEELSALALTSIEKLREFQNMDNEPSALLLQQVKVAQFAVSAWAKWKRTRTKRIALKEAIYRRTGGAASLPPSPEPIKADVAPSISPVAGDAP